jgi:hypothetical protein
MPSLRVVGQSEGQVNVVVMVFVWQSRDERVVFAAHGPGDNETTVQNDCTILQRRQENEKITLRSSWSALDMVMLVNVVM